MRASRYLRAFPALHELKIPVVSIAGASKRLPEVGRQGTDCQRGAVLGAAVLHPMFEVARGHQKRDQLALCPFETAAGGQVQLRLGPHVLGNHRQFKGCANTTDRLASFTDFFRFLFCDENVKNQSLTAKFAGFMLQDEAQSHFQCEVLGFKCSLAFDQVGKWNVLDDPRGPSWIHAKTASGLIPQVWPTFHSTRLTFAPLGAVGRSGVAVSGQSQPEQGAVLGRGFERDFTAVEARDVARQVKAQTGSRHLGCAFGAEIFVEDAWCVQRRDARACV
jgi:hypothetical protein